MESAHTPSDLSIEIYLHEIFPNAANFVACTPQVPGKLVYSLSDIRPQGVCYRITRVLYGMEGRPKNYILLVCGVAKYEGRGGGGAT